MCIIIQRDPGITLDREKFDTALENNPHGWGLSVPEGNGQLTTLRSVTSDGDEIYKLLHEEFKDDTIMLHLRYTTAGETILRNSHPFPILEYETDGVDIRMAHNGTIGKYKPKHNSPNKWESDTRVFVREYVRPLFKRLALGMESHEILEDPFVEQLLDDQLTAASVLSFIDGFGNTLQVNALGNGGKYEEGLYYSNVYSFNPSYRKPKATPSAPLVDQWGDDYMYGGGYYNSPRPEVKPTIPAVDVKENHAMDTKTESFMKKFGMSNSEELFLVSDTVLDYLVDNSPADLCLLAKEALAKAYQFKCDAARMETRNKQLEAKIALLEKEGKTDDKAA